MTRITEQPSSLRRPALMIRAARLGLSHYSRDRDLRSILGAQPGAGQALPALMDAEARAEATRTSGAAGYSLRRHLALLIALMAELHQGAPHPAG